MTKILENANQFWQEFSSISLFRYFSPLCSNLILKPISTPHTLFTSDVLGRSLQRCPTHLHFCVGQRPPQIELEVADFSQSTGSAQGHQVLSCLRSLPRHSHSVTACPSHPHWGVCTKSICFDGVLAQGRRQKAFSMGQGGQWAMSEAAVGCSVHPAGMQVKTSSEMWKCSSSRYYTSFPSCTVVNLTHFAAP